MASAYHYDHNSPPRFGERSKYNKYTDEIPQFEVQVRRIILGATEENPEPTFGSAMQRQGSQSSEYISEASDGYAYGMTRREFLTISRQRKESLEKHESPKSLIPAASQDLKPNQTRNVLRRKSSTIAQHTTIRYPQRTTSIPPVPQLQTVPNYTKSTSAPTRNQSTSGPWRPRMETSKEQAVPKVIPELDRYRSRTEPVKAGAQRVPPELPHKISTQDLPPPTQCYWNSSGHGRNSGCSGYSASAATRYSESPGSGPYSRDTTPSSVVSHSPAVSISLKTTRSAKQASPTRSRPPLANSRFRIPSDDEQSIPVLKSDSPRKENFLPAAQVIPQKEKSSRKAKLSDPPTPPTRKSSIKFSSPGRERSSSKDSSAAKIAVADIARASPATAAQTQGRSKTAPPTRPSREGAPDLIATLGDSMAVIQDNLATLDIEVAQSMGASTETIPRSTAPSPASSTTSSRPQFRSRLPSRACSPSPALIQRQPTPAISTAVVQSDARPGPAPMLPRCDSIRSPSPTTKPFKSRFGIFGKRTKSEDNTGKKVLRKGPTAGTGHEGYGKYAYHARGDSVGVPLTYARRLSNIATSPANSSKTSMDSFLSSRMIPVVISGGGGHAQSRNAGYEIGRDDTSVHPDVMSPSEVSLSSDKGEAKTTLWHYVPSRKQTEHTEKSSTPPVAAKRLSKRSYGLLELRDSLAMRRSLTKLKTSSQESNLPLPITTAPHGSSPAITSNDASIKSNRIDTKSTPKSDEAALANEVAKFKVRKERSDDKKAERTKTPRRWNFFSRTLGAGKKERDLSIGGSEEEEVGGEEEEEERIVAHYAMLDFEEQANMENEMGIVEVMREIRDMELAETAKAELRTEPSAEPTTPVSPPKELVAPITPPSIPQDLPSSSPDLPVPPRPSRLAQVGRIPQVVMRSKRSSRSFSQSFARQSFHETIPEIPNNFQFTVEPKFIDQDGHEIPASLGESSPGDFSSRRISSQSLHPSQQEFLRFSLLGGSQGTTSTSSTSRNFFEATIAIIPRKSQEFMEDEVWSEYDDLLDVDEDQIELPSATSSEGQPFRYENYGQTETEEDATTGEIRIGMEEDVLQEVNSQEFDFKFREAVNAAPTPTTPLSFTDFISTYGDRSVRNSVSRRTSMMSTTSNRSRWSVISEQLRSPMAQVNLRVGSMTVSKWLTFGDVLFSPARDSIPTEKSNIEFRVLVVDGLGNDDWSFYASETYPSTTFYNLSPSSAPSVTPSSNLPTSPSNHKQVQHLSFSSPFPFKNSYFDAVVIRFPPSSSPGTYRTLVSEAKRTLKPGGHLEMSILDLDMVNMGPRTRRAVRSLKVNLASQERDLTPTGDTMMRLLGENKFEGVKSCVVGIPVAHDISRKSLLLVKEESLVELMKGEGKEEGILRMVGKVGRWWWTRVYEGRGVWGERGVLRECEEWGTGFKLLVAYARKPIRGRGVSV